MLDSTSEAISHFIGLFQLSVEEMRLREKYDQFRHDKAVMDDLKHGDPKPREPTSFELEGYDPHLRWKPKFQQSPSAEKAASDGKASQAEPIPAASGLDARDVEPLPTSRLPPGEVAPPGDTDLPPAMTLLPPSSVATFTQQAARLEDDDVFGDIGFAGFALPTSFSDRLEALVEVAQGLSAIRLPTSEGAAPWVSTSAALQAQIAAAAEGALGPPGGAQATTLAGAAATGPVVDGAAAKAMPTLDDNLPAFLRPAEEEESAATPPGDMPEGFGSTQPDGHIVVAGGNVAVNEAEIVTGWLDAKVIAVRGDVTQMAVINQVNVLSDRDSLGDQGTPEAASKLLNAARIERLLGSTEDEEAVSSLSAVFPSNWAVTRIEGDLISYNWVEQATYTTDYDRAVVTSTGSNTYVGLGANVMTNTLMLAELGFQFDLIVVGGNMFDISVLTQWNVLLDDDLVSGGSASGGDNLLFNSASIAARGIDSFGALTSDFAGLVDTLAEGAASMPAFLAREGLFQGTEVLRVVYVSGDFVRMNVVEQINVMGDNDQVRIAVEARRGAGQEVEVVAGSNALANVAAIEEFGMDSTVLAGGEVYSEALIHQAGFVSPDAAPAGVGLAPGLPGEAVAFLADGMIDPAGPEEHLGPPPADSGSVDILQTMTA